MDRWMNCYKIVFQHAQSWKRRSLIDDAKFDTLTNLEIEKEEKDYDRDVSNSSQMPNSESGNVIADVAAAAAVSRDDNFAASTNGEGEGEDTPLTLHKVNLVLTIRETTGLSRVFKQFEVGIGWK